MSQKLRNIAIIAHVDHGKTTLVDQLLRQSGTLDTRSDSIDRVMDSNELERERGITILSKNTAIHWNDHQINIVDTPGHADFGGEVERVLSMVDSVLLLVDAVDGPMPQTRFVTQKAFAMGFKPIVVINKVDRDAARPHWVLDQTFDLFDKLGATDVQLDFPVVYASALGGYAGLEDNVREGDMSTLFETIINEVPAPDVNEEGPLQLQVSILDYNNYVGIIGIGRIQRGTIKSGMPVSVINDNGETRKGKISQVYRFHGLERIDVKSATAGDIVAFAGLDPLNISETICDQEKVEALPPLMVDEPTISMTFQPNTSPFAGKEGKYVTSRNIWERLEQELKHNVALRVETTEDADKYRVSGRGELHLSILIETMRREGYELAVGRPQVIVHDLGDHKEEPYEQLVVDIETEHQGAVMEKLGERRAELKDMLTDGKGRVRLEYIIPARGLIGFRTEFLTLSSGTGLLYNVFDHYGPYLSIGIGQRNNGVLIANGEGKAAGYSLFNLQERGKLFIGHAEDIYEGMIIGIHARDNDLVVNPLKGKQLTNVRASGTDENIVLTTPIKMTLEQALEFIDDDELVEVTPKSIRIRKKYLKEHERKTAARKAS
ncbi:MAG: translational GTPase TypA [Proteobacteria bacterium]|nr:translational GTPase TypA [Pseudomonadota bacterium]